MRNQGVYFIWAGILFRLIFSWPGTLGAQSRSYVYQHLDRESGLASSIVLAILQDQDGYMWFGTDNGLQRYDGRQFIHYRHDWRNPQSLASDLVEALLQDNQGTIWIASPTSITRYSPAQGTFTRIPVLALFKNNGLLRQWQLQECNNHILLVSKDQSVTAIFSPAQQAFVPVNTAKIPVVTCKTLIPNQETSLPGIEPFVFYKDKQGNTWAGANQLWVRSAQDSTFRTVPPSTTARYGLVYNHIYSITQNREGTIWLGTDKGIFYFNPEKQRFFTVNVAASKDNNAESDAVSGFLETQSGEIWVSSLNQGLRVYDQQLRLQRTYKQGTISNRQEIRCAVEDRHHQVWAGGNGQLLLFKNAGAPAITVHPSILTGQTVVKAALDKEGIIWWGTHTGLIVRHHPATGEFTSIPLKDQLGERELGQIKRILVSSDGTLWVATSLAGVLQVQATSGKILAHYTTATRPQGLLSNATGEMIWLNDATLAISTDQGLHYLDLKTRKITVLTTANGLPANALLNLVKASDKYLFVTTQFSLSRWNTQSKTATNYGARDGLLNESYAFNTGYRLRDGRILLGTLQGFYYFHPDSLMQSPPPKVLITGFRIFDKNIPLPATALQKKGIHLAYQQNFFTIEFASLNYYDDDKITYKYQLEGVDPDWRKAGRNRFASYTNLDGGTYRFKVMARLEDGTTNQQVTTLNLTIAKPFWKTWWFWAIVVIILAGLGYIGYKLRIQRLLALQQVRSRIARDLHDDMGSTLSTITIFSDLAKQQVLANPTVAEGYLQKISRYSHQMMSAMDDIVWSINPNNDSLQNLISRMREVATEVLEAKNIPFRIQTDPALNAVRLPLESRYDCFMIFKEALNNIAKYAHCSQVYIKVAIPDHTLHLEITDNGQGFDLQTANTGNGLLNMQKRAQTIKGHLQIKSEVGQGTTILLMAPLSKLSFKQVKV